MTNISRYRFWHVVQRALERARDLAPNETAKSAGLWVDGFLRELEAQGYRIVETTSRDTHLKGRARDFITHCPVAAFATDDQVHVMHKLIEDLAQ